MTGREEPSARSLEENLHKRMYIPATGPGSRKVGKRYNRHGVAHPAAAKSAGNSLKSKVSGAKAGAAKTKGGKGKG